MTAEPYLSIVATARNDDHGGNLLGRMQAFVNNWLAQARRFDIPSELILVEWNPPADRPRLAQALRWQASGPCSVRIIEVSPELHRRLAHADALPLYQMIAKNVGIRRARGQFVLVTNIDILFSSELAAFLAERRLDPGRMYRIDRHDAMSDAPVDADPETQLAYCRTHLIRVNRREGTFPPGELPGAVAQGTTTAGAAPPPPVGPALAPPGLALGTGWFPEERHGQQEVFRWAAKRAAIVIDRAPSPAHALEMEVEPGPGSDGPIALEIAGTGGFAASVTLTGRCRLLLRADWSRVTALDFAAKNHLRGTARDPRALAFRLFRAGWKRRAGGARTGAAIRPLPLARRAAILRDGLRHAATRLAYEGPLVNLTVFVSPAMRRLLRAWVAPPDGAHRAAQDAAAGDDATPGLDAEAIEPEFLHTNACGDFTLLARDKWFDLRGYPEFDLFSMNLDSVFCFVAHHGGARELVLEDPMRIYHIEHGTGSGWTPEGQAKLFRRIRALGLSFLDNDTVMGWAQQMRRLDAPMIFNHEDWGFADCELPETVPVEGA